MAGFASVLEEVISANSDGFCLNHEEIVAPQPNTVLAPARRAYEQDLKE